MRIQDKIIRTFLIFWMIFSILIAIDWYTEFHAFTNTEGFFWLFAILIGISVLYAFPALIILAVIMIRKRQFNRSIVDLLLILAVSVINWNTTWADMLW